MLPINVSPGKVILVLPKQNISKLFIFLGANVATYPFFLTFYFTQISVYNTKIFVVVCIGNSSIFESPDVPKQERRREKAYIPNFCFEAFREHLLHGQSAPTSKEVLSLFLLLLKWPMMLIFGWICLWSWMVAQLGQQSTVQQSSIMEPCNIVMMMTMIAMIAPRKP